MFLLDSILLAPGKAAYFLIQELAKKAQEEWLDDDSVKQELQEIYAMFEAGKLSDKEFEAREYGLVQRLQQIALAKLHGVMPAAAEAPAVLDTTAVIDLPRVEDEAPPAAGTIPVPEEAPPATSTAAKGSEIPFAAIAASLQPLLDMVAASVARPGQDTESQLTVQTLDQITDALPRFDPAPAPPAPAPPITPSALLPPSIFQPPPAPDTTASPSVVPPVPAAPAAGGLSITEVVDSALRGLSLLRLKVSSITAVSRTADGWRVTTELVERRGVPDSSDLLGIYELRLDGAGNVLQWERTRMRRRCDLS